MFMKSRLYLKQGHAGLKTMSVGQILENTVYFLDRTVFIQSSKKFARVVISMKYWLD